MKTALVILAALTSFACSAPDRRYAQVVVENEELQEATGEAISNWQKAVGSEIDWVLSNSCDDSSRTCVKVRLSKTNDSPPVPDAVKDTHPKAIVGGYTDGHVADVSMDRTEIITILPWYLGHPAVKLFSLVTHEMGHALGIKHLNPDGKSGEPDFDVMYPIASESGHDCIGPLTLQAYDNYYGSCSMQGDCKTFCW